MKKRCAWAWMSAYSGLISLDLWQLSCLLVVANAHVRQIGKKSSARFSTAHMRQIGKAPHISAAESEGFTMRLDKGTAKRSG